MKPLKLAATASTKNICTRVLAHIATALVFIVFASVGTVIYSIALLGAFALFYVRIMHLTFNIIKRVYFKK